MPFLDSRYLTQAVAPAEHDRMFVAGYLSALGAATQWIDESLLRAELTRDQLCELEGRPVRTWYAQHSLPELATLYLWLDGASQAPDPRAESGARDTFRFELMRRSARRIGAVTRLRMVPRHEGDEIRYVPVIVFGFEVALCCLRRTRKAVAVAVDLRSGAAGEQLAHRILESRLDTVAVPPAQVLRRELRFKHAFEIACEWVKDCVARDERTWDWYHHAVRRLRVELDQVETYFAEQTRTGETSDLSAERAQAVEEVRRRFSPRVEARAVLAALVYCPEEALY